MPFCRRKCLYCDFYSQTDLSLTDSYVKAVVRRLSEAMKDVISCDKLRVGANDL